MPEPTTDAPDFLEVIVDTPNEKATVVRVRSVGKDDEWYTKDEVAEKERQSKQIWDGIDDQQRQAVLVLVRDSLQRLTEDPEVWVPTSVEPITGSRIDVFVSIHLAEVDEEVLRRRLETERMIAEDTTGLLELEEALRPDQEEDEGDDAPADA